MNPTEVVCTLLELYIRLSIDAVELVGVAKGLAYIRGLHPIHEDPKGVHGNLKSDTHICRSPHISLMDLLSIMLTP